MVHLLSQKHYKKFIVTVVIAKKLFYECHADAYRHEDIRNKGQVQKEKKRIHEIHQTIHLQLE